MNTLSGYTEIKLPDGKIIPLKFSTWTLRQLCKKWNIPLSDFNKEVIRREAEDNFTLTYDLVCVAAEYASHVAGKPESFTDIQVSMWIGETGELQSPIWMDTKRAFWSSVGVDIDEVLATALEKIEEDQPAEEEAQEPGK